MKFTVTLIAAMTAAAPALAAGDAAKGEDAFKQCQTCHTVTDLDGNRLAGKGAKVGPNLYGIFGREAGTLEGFKYGEDIVAVGAAGLVWNEADFIDYVQDPAAFLKAKLDDKGAKSKMAFKVKTPEMAADLYAYLAQFSPAPADAGATEAAPADGAAATTSP
jgi:cytochrome c